MTHLGCVSFNGLDTPCWFGLCTDWKTTDIALQTCI